MIQLDPYLIFNGQCEEAFRFYADLLGGKIETMTTHEQSPMRDQTAPEWHSKIMHARMTIGDRVLMGSDGMPGKTTEHHGFSASLQVNDAAEAERIFHALEKDGRVVMPLTETYWAHRFGMLVDRFGIPWMVNCERAA